MKSKRAQNIIAEGKIILPLCILIIGFAWVEAGYLASNMWMQGLCLALAIFLMEMANNVHSLLRVESHMTGSVLILLNVMALYLVPDIRTDIIELCMAGFFFTVFYSYEQKQTAGWIYYSFLCLGLASLVYVKVLLFVPLFWILTLIYLRSLNLKSFIASIFGLITPYWFALAFYLYESRFAIGEFVLPTNHFALLSFTDIFNFRNIGEHQIITIGWSILLALISIIHYSRQGYHDNIRSRVLYKVFLITCLATIFLMILQPQDIQILQPILYICLAPLLAHFLTLTTTWLTNIAFFLIILITLAITAYNLWMPSSNILSAMVTGVC